MELIVFILTVFLILPTILYLTVLVDSVSTKALFFKGVGQEKMVILFNLGGTFMKVFAKVRGWNFNPETGVGKKGEEQANFYESGILNHFANFWGIYYKGINTRASEEIPFRESVPVVTKEAEVAGLPFNINTLVTTRKTDISKYLSFGEDVDPFSNTSAEDYHSGMRTLASKKGKERDAGGNIDYRAIMGIGTELQADNDFKTGPKKALKDSIRQYGMELDNIAIGLVEPANDDTRRKIAEEASAEITKRVKIKAAQAAAEEVRLISQEKAAAETREGNARVEVEKKHIENGVTPAYRNAMAIEKQPGLNYLSQGNVGGGAYSINEGEPQKP